MESRLTFLVVACALAALILALVAAFLPVILRAIERLPALLGAA